MITQQLQLIKLLKQIIVLYTMLLAQHHQLATTPPVFSGAPTSSISFVSFSASKGYYNTFRLNGSSTTYDVMTTQSQYDSLNAPSPIEPSDPSGTWVGSYSIYK